MPCFANDTIVHKKHCSINAYEIKVSSKDIKYLYHATEQNLKDKV